MNLDPGMVKQQIENLKLSCPEAWTDGDDQLLADMLEAQTDMKEFLTIVEDRRQDACAMAGGIAGRIAELELRQRRYERREQAMRELALKIMQAANCKKQELPIATLSVTKGRDKVVISDEASVPDILCRIERSPDKTKIKEVIKGAINDGVSINWAAIVPGEPTLSIHTK